MRTRRVGAIDERCVINKIDGVPEVIFNNGLSAAALYPTDHPVLPEREDDR